MEIPLTRGSNKLFIRCPDVRLLTTLTFYHSNLKYLIEEPCKIAGKSSFQAIIPFCVLTFRNTESRKHLKTFSFYLYNTSDLLCSTAFILKYSYAYASWYIDW